MEYDFDYFVILNFCIDIFLAFIKIFNLDEEAKSNFRAYLLILQIHQDISLEKR